MYELDLFEEAQDEPSNLPTSGVPLAARMRPKSLQEFLGHDKLVGKNGLLTTVFGEGRLNSSLIFWGPPGSGKTTLAHLVAQASGSKVHKLSAVDSGVKELRAVVAQTIASTQQHILFIDEIHRYNKTQQDALLPVVESGQVRLLGATTENPYFELRKALLSRSRVVRLEKLEASSLLSVLRRALSHPEGYGEMSLEVEDVVLEQLAQAADGDARSALNLLELAVARGSYGPEGQILVKEETVEQLFTDQNLAYFRQGDRRYDLVSAFIKSIRGSDPDAALYWLATMLSAGEDPKYLMRRLLISASEDIGLADPSAVTVVAACARALEWVGLPEGKYHLSQATLYLATAAKSDSLKALFRAEAQLKRSGPQEVPSHLRDGSYSGAKEHGIGQGYVNPHGRKTKQSYLPEGLPGTVFYEPGKLGYEKVIRQRLEHWHKMREA